MCLNVQTRLPLKDRLYQMILIAAPRLLPIDWSGPMLYCHSAGRQAGVNSTVFQR